MRDEKLHAVVARSRFASQNAENTSAPDHFWKLRCRKSARRCGAKHISKWKCTVHQWLRSAIRDSQQPTSPIGFLFLKLPPPPCAVLPVHAYIYIYLGLQNTWNLSGLPKYLVFQHFGDIKPGSLFKTPGFHDLPGQVLLRCRFKTLFGLIYPTHVLSEIDWTVFKWIDQGSCKVWTCNCASWRNVFFFHQSCKYEWNLPLHLDIACL